jgi:hypothetical protein
MVHKRKCIERCIWLVKANACVRRLFMRQTLGNSGCFTIGVVAESTNRFAF